jgi:hypothetical protein
MVRFDSVYRFMSTPPSCGQKHYARHEGSRIGAQAFGTLKSFKTTAFSTNAPSDPRILGRKLNLEDCLEEKRDGDADSRDWPTGSKLQIPMLPEPKGTAVQIQKAAMRISKIDCNHSFYSWFSV